MPARGLSMYTIYYRPVDMPGVQYVVRRWDANASGEPVSMEVLGQADTLQEARDLVPLQADACFPRAEEDDPVIIETWF